MEEKQALVSCIMPTYNRRRFVPNAIDYFLRQDYPNKELIIIDDGTDLVEDLIPVADNIRYYSLPKKISLGTKLNIACEHAHGNIIVNWDDDDWYAPWRLTYQLSAMQEEGTELCGINNLLYYDLVNECGYNYIYPADQKVWLAGSSQCYKKSLWEQNKFADINVGMDGLFVWATPVEKIKVLEDSSFSVHMIHQKNGSEKKTAGGWWHDYPLANIEDIIGDDWSSYRKITVDKKMTSQMIQKSFPAKKAKKKKQVLKNIFACLVHEKEECILDLVRNLNYHNPDCTLLLYNGGNNPNLVKNPKAFEKFGAIWHPTPTPQKHGYLHGFALDCMEYALDNFTFDAFTIVDSDQLCLRGGYAAYLNTFFKKHPNAGLLSNQPSRVTIDQRHNHVALQAFKEKDLWQPLLDEFADSESKFVHWTFWPSTVFSAQAIRDLLQLFQENKNLQHIMKHTKIWATEEVIFPTLISLLGYDIIKNPCSDDYVKYKTKFGIANLDAALKREDVFWMHPVDRIFNHPLRKHTRQCFHQYNSPAEIKRQQKEQVPTGIVEIINSAKKIKGWLSDKEADLLVTTALKACLASDDAIVEIGSFHGKATTILGSLAKLFFPKVKVIAIDPHDGRLGAIDLGIQQVSPSYENFIANIHRAGLSEIVSDIRDHSFNVKWSDAISFLLIDGLHDYLSVARDFEHFAPWVRPNGLIAFHDYADYYPGVQSFVNELLTSGKYTEVAQVDSLIVLSKK